MNKIHVAIALLLVAEIALAAAAYARFPSTIAAHWNASGQLDSYQSRSSVFILPMISILITGLLIFLPRLDPLRKNFELFRRQYDVLILVFTLYLLYVSSLTILYNQGIRFNMVSALVPGFAGLFYYIGIMLGSVRQNWFVGIRTPWTLSDENVWDKTHKMAAALFKASALLSLPGLIVGNYALFFILVPICAASLFCVVYSYLEWRKLHKK